MLRAWKIIVPIVLAFGVLFVAAGFFAVRFVLSMRPEPRFAKVSRGEITARVSGTGTIESERQVVVKSKVAGRVVKLTVDEGDVVRAGDLIARIDPTEIRRQWNQIQADIQAANARVQQARFSREIDDSATQWQLERARADLKSASAEYDKTKAGARKEEIARADAALKQAQSRMDDARLNLDRQRDWVARGIARKQAEADLRASEANLARVKAGPRRQEIVTGQTAVDRARASLEEARRRLERKRQLRTEGFVSDQDVEIAETQFKTAEQDLKSASEQLAMLKEGSRSEDIRAAEAQAERLRVFLEQTRENEKQAVESANAQFDIAKHAVDSAKQDLALLKAGSRPEDILAAEAQLRRMEAGLRESQVRRSQKYVNDQEIAASRAQVARLRESLNNISTQLDDTIVRTPISGVVTHRALREGELVTSGISSFTAGMEIVTVADMSSLTVKVRINEVDVAKLYLGQKTSVTVDALPGEKFVGKITKIAPASRRSITPESQQGQGGQSGTSEIVWFDVEVRLPQADRKLKPGMTADIEVITAHLSNVARLPREAVLGDGVENVTYKVTDAKTIEELERRQTAKKDVKKTVVLTEDVAKAERIPVRIGQKDDQFAEIKSGLRDGEWVLIKSPEGQRKTFDIGKPPRDRD